MEWEGCASLDYIFIITHGYECIRLPPCGSITLPLLTRCFAAYCFVPSSSFSPSPPIYRRRNIQHNVLELRQLGKWTHITSSITTLWVIILTLVAWSFRYVYDLPIFPPSSIPCASPPFIINVHPSSCNRPFAPLSFTRPSVDQN